MNIKSQSGKHARFLTDKSSDMQISNRSGNLRRNSTQKSGHISKKQTYEEKRQKIKRSLTISQNEQELLQEIRERMQEYMKEEEHNEAGKKAKGFFDTLMEQYQAEK